MLIFELRINGKLVGRAGRQDLSVLSSCVSAVGKLGPESAGPPKETDGTDIHVHLGGMTSNIDRSQDVHLNWNSHTDLSVGDEVMVKIVEGNEADAPVKKAKPVDQALREKSERDMYESARKYYFDNRAKYEPER